MPAPNWTTGFVSLGASLMLIVTVVEIPTALLILLAYSLFATLGGVVANYPGAILCVTSVALVSALCTAAYKTGYVSEDQLVKSLAKRGKTLADGTSKLLDSNVSESGSLANRGHRAKISVEKSSIHFFCKEAFLLKQSSQECEFTHRLLRDYFALRELRPTLSASDKRRRLEAIRFLGYQGEAALDVLTEFADDQDFRPFVPQHSPDWATSLHQS
jgi:hypothetical protein